VLVFRLQSPARLLITVFGPGPGCERLGTFNRRGRPGVNRVRFTGTLFGRELAPGRYAVVVEAVRGERRTRIGRVLVVILARDGREGGNRLLAAPDCRADRVDALAPRHSSQARLASNDSSGRDDGSSAGGVAGASASGGTSGTDDDGPLLPNLPALPELPTIPVEDAFGVPSWAFVALAILGGLGAAALVGAGIRRRRENASWD
jgi:hypothetical protein